MRGSVDIFRAAMQQEQIFHTDQLLNEIARAPRVELSIWPQYQYLVLNSTHPEPSATAVLKALRDREVVVSAVRSLLDRVTAVPGLVIRYRLDTLLHTPDAWVGWRIGELHLENFVYFLLLPPLQPK